MSGVRLANVHKVYDAGVVAVRDFNLDIAPGEFVVFVGPSGCGKSTTLRMIAGLEEITSGTIRIGERVVNDVPPKDRDIAMVFQNYALYPHMTVYENMAFGLMLRKAPRRMIDERVRRAAKTLGIETLLDRRPKALSGGQRQRVAVGRAIVREPQCFLFDEPLSNLDAKLRVEMRVELKRLHMQLRSTTVYVTHDQEEAMTLGDRVVVMKDGVIQQCGPALEIYHQPANRFVASFLGSPPMNFLSGRLGARGGKLEVETSCGSISVPDWAVAGLEPLIGSPLTIGVRPEAVGESGRLKFKVRDEGLQVRLELVQPLGSYVVAHLAGGGEAIVAQLPRPPAAGIGEQVRIHFDPDALHFFAADEEARTVVSQSHAERLVAE